MLPSRCARPPPFIRPLPPPRTPRTTPAPRTVPAPRLGDDTLSFRVTQVLPADESGGSISLDTLVLLVRTGPTVAVFIADNDSTPARPATMAAAVVKAQIAKLR